MPPRPPTPLPAAWRRPGLLAAALVGIGLLAYLPMLPNGFVWDDDTFLTQNALIHAPDGLSRFWFSTQASDYWPVTSTSLWLEWRLWGMHAAGYHATNLALHLGESLLLWSILRRLRVPGAYLAALLFAVHPVNVESVAWIAQRKNLMAMLFYLLSLRLFLATRWSDGPVSPAGPAGGGDPSRERRLYAGSLLAFVLAMLSKGSVAPLPVVLLGIIAWRRRITRRDGAALAPFFLVAVVLIGVNVWFQTHGWSGVIRQASGLERLLGAGAVVWFYFAKALLPVGLVFVYPQWHVAAADGRWWVPLLGVAAVTALLAVRARAGRREAPAGPTPAGAVWWRGALFAWAYFVVLLLPVMGFTDVYFMRYSLVADHYQHLAIIGILGFAAAAWAAWSAGPGGPAPVKIALAAGLVAGLAVLTGRQCGMYRDTATLYRVTLERNPGCWMVYNNLGLLESAAGRTDAARHDFDRALALNPHFYEASLNVGNSEAAAGRYPEALARYEQALRDKPDYPEAYYSIGNLLHRAGENAQAITAYGRALRLRPDYPDAENNLGIALADSGQGDAAIGHYRRALELEPADAEAHYNLANVWRGAGRSEDAIGEYQAALRLRPDYPDAAYNLAESLERVGRVPEAIDLCAAVVRSHAGDCEAHNHLGVALALAGRLEDAAGQFEAALRIRADYAPAQQNLARVRAMRK